MTDKPENFVVTFKGKRVIVERHFELPNGNEISYRHVIKDSDLPDDPSMLDLHRVSADITIRYLLQFLPEGYDADRPYKAGEKLAL